jgi:hypothetical protein
MNYVANVLDDDSVVFPDLIAQAPRKVDTVLYAFDGYGLQLHDPSDPDDGPLYLCYGTDTGGTVFAPDAESEVEVERRIVRCLGLDVYIDCVEESADQTTVTAVEAAIAEQADRERRKIVPKP